MLRKLLRNFREVLVLRLWILLPAPRTWMSNSITIIAPAGWSVFAWGDEEYKTSKTTSPSPKQRIIFEFGDETCFSSGYLNWFRNEWLINWLITEIDIFTSSTLTHTCSRVTFVTPFSICTKTSICAWGVVDVNEANFNLLDASTAIFTVKQT